MSNTATGRVLEIGEIQQVSDRFRKRTFVLEIEDGKYPQYVEFQLTGDRCDDGDKLSVGDKITLTYNLRGRMWTSPKGEVRYFNSLDVWKFDMDENSASGADAPPPLDDDSDIPF